MRKYGSRGMVWSCVATIVKTRNSTQCRERYRNVLAGKRLLRPWTEQETKRLKEYCKEKIINGRRIKL